MGVYSIGVSALHAANIGLTTTSNNIANVNTEGYRRQVVTQENNIPRFTGSGFLGNGVNVTNVARVYNEFLDRQVLAADTQLSYLTSYAESLREVDNMVADSSAGLSPAIAQFFQAVNDVATNPASVPARQSLISGANALVSRMQGLNDRFDEMREGVNTRVQATVQEINGHVANIAELNDRIYRAEAASSRLQANDLRDLRDRSVANLNELVKTTKVVNSTGGYDIFIGNGQPVVLGGSAYELAARPANEDPNRMEVYYELVPGQYTHIKSDLLTGGTLGGVLEFRSRSLDPAQNSLGRVTLGLAHQFNNQHMKGMDLDMDQGGAFFAIPGAMVQGNVNNSPTAEVRVDITDVGRLTTNDYRLTYDGANYVLTSLPDETGRTLTFANAPGDPVGTPPRTQIDGLTIHQPTMAAGDILLIQPTRIAARDIGVAVSDPNRVAAALPIRSTGSVANLGDATISQPVVNTWNDKVKISFTSANTFDVVNETTGAVLDTGVPYAAPQNISYNGWTAQLSGNPSSGDTFTVDGTYSEPGIQRGSGAISLAAPDPGPAYQLDANLNEPVAISFNGPPNTGTFNVTGVGTGNPVNVPYTPGMWLNYNGWSAQLTGTPQPGDSFSVGPNDSGVADNRNALDLAGLQTRQALEKNRYGDATASFNSSYARTVSSVGSKTRELDVSQSAQETLVMNLKTSQQSFEGVNLDEEAANLLRYQQAYQAAAKTIQTASIMFDTLLGISN